VARSRQSRRNGLQEQDLEPHGPRDAGILLARREPVAAIKFERCRRGRNHPAPCGHASAVSAPCTLAPDALSRS